MANIMLFWYNGEVDAEGKGKAALIRVLPPGKGTGKSMSKGLYRLDPPISWSERVDDLEILHMTNYVVVSAIVATYSGPETYIFPSDADGKILDHGGLDGSMNGTLDPVRVLEAAGYKIVNGVERAAKIIKENK